MDLKPDLIYLSSNGRLIMLSGTRNKPTDFIAIRPDLMIFGSYGDAPWVLPRGKCHPLDLPYASIPDYLNGIVCVYLEHENGWFLVEDGRWKEGGL